jgi:UDP-N-acetylglucosamine 2-epimerase
MHRAENTDFHENMVSVIKAFQILATSESKKDETGGNVIIFPIHPRTERLLKEKNLYRRLLRCKNVRFIEPVGYLDFIKLIANAAKIITDSGGIQKEAYLLGVPCITIRKSTEWVETVKEGWNKLTDTNTERIVRAVKSWHRYNRKRPNIFGSGKTSSVIRDILLLSQDK